MVDFGYDISNYTDIEPQFGTLDDFKRMAEEFRKRGMNQSDILNMTRVIPNALLWTVIYQYRIEADYGFGAESLQ